MTFLPHVLEKWFLFTISFFVFSVSLFFFDVGFGTSTSVPHGFHVYQSQNVKRNKAIFSIFLGGLVYSLVFFEFPSSKMGNAWDGA